MLRNKGEKEKEEMRGKFKGILEGLDKCYGGEFLNT